jgi:NAD+ kinase
VVGQAAGRRPENERGILVDLPQAATMTINSIGLFGNLDKEDIHAAVQFIRARCASAGVQVLLTRQLAAVVGGEDGLPTSELVAQVDVVMALGGDGTMLQAARALGSTGTALLGVNLGSLGYLTDVPVQEVGRALDGLLSGDYHLERRSRVSCMAWRNGQQLATLSALNDIVLNMGPLPRALELEARLASESLGRFLGDGIIVSTPTGSTAYSLSAGGPVCHPDVPCLLVTPICPHSLGMRPLIVPEGIPIEVMLHQVGQGAQLTADGQVSETLHDGDHVVFRVAEGNVCLVKFPQSNFYRVLRHKLDWGAPKRQGKPG